VGGGGNAPCLCRTVALVSWCVEHCDRLARCGAVRDVADVVALMRAHLCGRCGAKDRAARAVAVTTGEGVAWA
jgi:hypothetical protein